MMTTTLSTDLGVLPADISEDVGDIGAVCEWRRRGECCDRPAVWMVVVFHAQGRRHRVVRALCDGCLQRLKDAAKRIVCSQRPCPKCGVLPAMVSDLITSVVSLW